MAGTECNAEWVLEHCASDCEGSRMDGIPRCAHSTAKTYLLRLNLLKYWL